MPKARSKHEISFSVSQNLFTVGFEIVIMSERERESIIDAADAQKY